LIVITTIIIIVINLLGLLAGWGWEATGGSGVGLDVRDIHHYKKYTTRKK